MTISSRNSPGWAGSMSRWRRPLLFAMIILQIDFNRVFAIPREGDAPIRRDMDRVAGALARQRVKVHADHRDLRRLGCRIKPRQNKAHPPIRSNGGLVVLRPIQLESLGFERR